MSLQEFVASYQQRLDRCYRELSLEKLQRVLEILAEAYRNGKKVFFLGNGGSAATASHMCCDFGKASPQSGSPRLRSVGLTDNVPLLTAWANDSGYEVIFEEQLATLLEPGDVVVGISASGNSPNVLRAIEYANGRQATTIGFIGFGGGKLKDLVQVDITVSSTDYGIVEDFHLCLNHILSQYFKRHIESLGSLARATGAH